MTLSPAGNAGLLANGDTDAQKTQHSFTSRHLGVAAAWSWGHFFAVPHEARPRLPTGGQKKQGRVPETAAGPLYPSQAGFSQAEPEGRVPVELDYLG